MKPSKRRRIGIDELVRGKPVLPAIGREAFLWFFLVSGLLFSSGCLSIRSTTNLKPPPDAVTLTTRYKIRLEKVQFSVEEKSQVVTCLPMAALSPKELAEKQAEWEKQIFKKGPEPQAVQQTAWTWDEAKWLAKLKQTGAIRYPAIFADGPGAYPLSISIKVKGKAPHPAKIVPLVFLSGLGILPMGPLSEIIDFEVGPILLLDDGMTPVPLSTVQFQRKDTSWATIFSPLGFIPVPGHSDKRDTLLILEQSPPLNGYALNVESCVDAIVLALQSSEDDIRKALVGSIPSEGLRAP